MLMVKPAPTHTPSASSASPASPAPPDRCRFFTVRLGQDKEGKGDKRTREENRTESCSVKLTSKSRNARFFVLTLPCLLVYLSTLSYLNLNLKKPTLVSPRPPSYLCSPCSPCSPSHPTPHLQRREGPGLSS
jgi:hypothetical protein